MILLQSVKQINKVNQLKHEIYNYFVIIYVIKLNKLKHVIYNYKVIIYYIKLNKL